MELGRAVDKPEPVVDKLEEVRRLVVCCEAGRNEVRRKIGV